jgi:thiosulfate dehydrogenase [quinone] large subunit
MTVPSVRSVERINGMSESTFEKSVILYFRLAIGWTFLYAGGSQLLGHFSAAGFLGATKTFHPFFVWFAAPGMLPYTDFLVKWGHLLIGLSLISGLLVRVSAPFGILLLGTYYFAHMDFPYIEGPTNMIIDYHLIYMGVLVYLIAKHAGHVFGLDGWVEKLPVIANHASLKPLVN